VSDFGKTGCGDQTNISGADHGYTQDVPPNNNFTTKL
jgi:hypothetical protein